MIIRQSPMSLKETTQASLRLVSIIVGLAFLAIIEVPAQYRDGWWATAQIDNGMVNFSVTADSVLRSDRLINFGKISSTVSPGVTTDGDFGLEVMWTDWQAPGKANNAENPITLTKTNFRFSGAQTSVEPDGSKDLDVYLRGMDHPLQVRLRYHLGAKSYYGTRTLSVRDTTNAGHYLQIVSSRDGELSLPGKPNIVKKGGFGQPIALTTSEGGCFFGLEFPAADNVLTEKDGKYSIRCSQEIGERIGTEWLTMDPVVEGVTPDSHVKQWFMKYVDDIRVAPLAPYTLYNSWYDLRSPEYPKVQPGNVMNEKNIFHIIDLIKQNMIVKHDIKLDAFVLDDGWDVYKSDWVMRKEQFPNGLKPISDELKKTNTHLGIWFGPIGGYSFRKQRVGWMKEHGYEVIGDQMCVGGQNYSKLLKQRVSDFTEKEGVGYFKWDGIQFSCSDPTHGHPVGIYSRRAVMKSVIDMVNATRSKNPEMFLNITSGTWLSPWWVKYANQIWMQGEDYGYADVPSISPRDAAITYRDLALYDDFATNDFWFPIQNLMTHGIIKGNLEWLGGKEEPLDKFTNEVLLYFARGVSMWELYISPDILSDGEWDAMAQAMHWARDRFPLLRTTEMIGGDPKKRQTYGYVHFNGSEGVIAARNPWIEPSKLDVTLDPVQGLDEKAKDMVLEQVYPVHKIFLQTYNAGDKIALPLDGYELAVYELYPLAKATKPLIAGVEFEEGKREGTAYNISLYGSLADAKVLNATSLSGMSSGGSSVSLSSLKGTEVEPPVQSGSAHFEPHTSGVSTEFSLSQTVQSATLGFLVTPAPGTMQSRPPTLMVTIDGKKDTAKYEKGEGSSTWYTIAVGAGKHSVTAEVQPHAEKSGEKPWRVHLATWLIAKQQQKGTDVTLTTPSAIAGKPMPPSPLPAGQRMLNVKLGESDLMGADSRQ